MASVLIVEDEPIAAWSLREALELLGHEVIDEVPSGQRAIQIARDARPDLVLIDIQLAGDIDGIEAADTIQRRLQIPVVYLTAYGDETTVHRALKTTPLGYVVKPFRRRELQTSIDIALNHHRQAANCQGIGVQTRAVLADLEAGVITLDSGGRVTFINPAAERLTAWPAAEAVGQPIGTVLTLETATPAGTKPSPVSLALPELGLAPGATLGESPGFVREQDCELISRQGDRHWIGLVVRGLGDSTGIGSGAILTLQDQTRRQQLQQQLLQQAEHQGLLSQMAAVIHQAIELDPVLLTATREIRRRLQLDRVLIYRLDPQMGGTVVAESVGESQMALQGSAIADPCLHSSACWERYRAGYVHAIEDLAQTQLTGCYRERLQQYGVQANLVLPIVICPDRVWGLLVLHHCQSPRQWPQGEIRLMQQVVIQLGFAIQQQLLVEQTQLQARQAALLNGVVQAMRTSLDLEQILAHTARSVLEAVQASRCVVRLKHPAEDRFTHQVQAALNPALDLPDPSMPIGDNPLVNVIFQQPTLLAIADVKTTDWLQPLQPYFQRSHIRGFMAIAIRIKGELRGMLSVHHCGDPRCWPAATQVLLQQVAEQLGVAIQQAELYSRLRQANQELARLAHLDGLTQVANRRFLDEFLSREYRRHLDSGEDLSLLLCDVDHFKHYNDTYGHLAGDDTLKLVASAILTELKRPEDLLARYGGEEFVVVLPKTPLSGAIAVAQRIQRRLRSLRIEHRDSATSPWLTLSMGIASLKASATTDQHALVRAADQALYRAKHQGRDRYQIASVEGGAPDGAGAGGLGTLAI